MNRLREWAALLRGAKGAVWILLAALVAAVFLALGGRGGGAAGNALEARLAGALSLVRGAGRVQLVIGEGEGAGVLVVAEGADDIRVRLELARAVCAVLPIAEERVEVLKMGTAYAEK